MKKLEDILKEMKSYRELGDAEKAHYYADHLLIELIEYLKNKGSSEESDSIDEIISTYKSIEKWYV